MRRRKPIDPAKRAWWSARSGQSLWRERTTRSPAAAAAAASICSLVETCKLNGIEPYAWLKDVLTRMVAGHPVNRLDELLPWKWEPPDPLSKPERRAHAGRRRATS